jgi:hypothetical protein
MAYVSMKPAFGDQSAWRFFHAWFCLARQACGFIGGWL